MLSPPAVSHSVFTDEVQEGLFSSEEPLSLGMSAQILFGSLSF